MKVRIIKPVWLFEEIFVVGKVYESRERDGGEGVYIDPNDGYGEYFISVDEYEIVEE